MESAELKVFDSKGKQVGTKSASKAVFQAPISQAILHEVVRWQRAKKRAGTHAVKTRAEASGGGRKPWKQKGTGNARAGSNTSPLWVGGGIAHGPKPRSYEFSINRKQRRQAVCSALTARAQDEKCWVVKDFGFKEAKTKAASDFLAQIGIEKGSRVTVVVADDDRASKLSFRNLEKVRVLGASGINPYDVLHAEYVVLSEAALESVEARLGGSVDSKDAKATPKEKTAKKTAAKKASKSAEKSE